MTQLNQDKNRRILVIDDNRAIHEDFRKILSADTSTAAALDVTEAALFGKSTKVVQKIHYEIDSAYQGQDGVLLVKQALETGRPYAMAFVDIRMPPGMDGVETTVKIWQADPDLQIVLCTAYADYSWDEMFEKIGNSDGVVILKKPFDTVEALQLAQTLTEKWWLNQQSKKKMEELERMVGERTRELQQTNEALQRQKTELRLLFDWMPAMVWFKDTENGILRVNKQAAETTGKLVADIEGKSSFEIYPHDAAKFHADDLEVIHSGTPKLGIVETFPDRDGNTLWVQTDKVPVFDQAGKVTGIVVMAQDITERKRAEESLRLLSSAVEQSKESIVITDADLDRPGPKIIFVNPAFTEMTGYTSAEALGKSPRILQGPRSEKAVLSRLRKNLEQGETFAGETINYRKDGTEFNLEWQIAPLRNTNGKVTHFVAIQRDITERKRLEARLFQSQKMETVGKLAGGIAHEFNSILTAIIGQSELLLGDLPKGSPLGGNVIEITRAASRAATLTRQLLAYGRKQFLQPEPLDLNQIITGMESMFHNLMGGGVKVQIVPATGLHPVKADAGQIEQVIINMAMNARDAMPAAGHLMLETANVSLDQEYVSCFPEFEIKAGEYVMLAITDTGAGMSAEVKARVFEPFFSTKGVGEGSGLGLSTCYGIIKQSGGHISVYSEPGRGTTFKIYLPPIESQGKKPVLHPDSLDLPRGIETILLVEDDPALREMAATLLRRLGYTVLAAANGIEALSLKHEHRNGHIDLLFTDVVMPHMSGKELADRVRALYPHTRILFTSAYTENAILHQGIFDKGVALLQKPFTPSALARRLREVLD